MTLREQVVEEALTWLGTPYHHLACLKGVGVDCGRFLEGVGKVLGVIPASFTPATYSPQHHLHRREEVYRDYFLRMGCTIVPWEDMTPGVMITFRLGHVVSHSGIYMPNNQIIHAIAGRGVIMHAMQGAWVQRHDLCYDFPALPVSEEPTP